MASTINAKNTSTGVVITPDSSGQLELQTADTTRMTIDVNGNVGVGTSSPTTPLSVLSSAGNSLATFSNTNAAYAGDIDLTYAPSGVTASKLQFSTRSTGATWLESSYGALTFRTGTGGSASERMRIDSSGNVLVGTTSAITTGSSTAAGCMLSSSDNYAVFYRADNPALIVGRQNTDGTLVTFTQAGVAEGSISVSGTTVSYNGGHLSRWSQLYNETTQVEVYRGTVLESVDAMCEWYDEEGNLRPNEQATKTIVSTTPASKAVAGVFDVYDKDDEDNPYDFYVAQSGDFVIRLAAGTVVQNGDLLESAGDGTARVQADDICRSSTIAKVTSNYVSETYADGSFCVPCILMIG